MTGRQRILPVRREYNRWVANETLEDFALRFTAKSARRWSAPRVSQTAIGAISFLALEAIGGAITLSYGFANVLAATLVVGVVLFLTGLPISRYAARYGVDIDLLTRGAGFGYIGSTVTSLVYATFTFILFAIEASIMAAALQLFFGMPLAWRLSAERRRRGPARHPWHHLDQPVPALDAAAVDRAQPSARSASSCCGTGTACGLDQLSGPRRHGAGGLDLLRFGGAASVILALMPQIGEQVDVLRFLPVRSPTAAGRTELDRARCWRPGRAGSCSAPRSCCSARCSRFWRCGPASRPDMRPSRPRCTASPSATCCLGRRRSRCSRPPSWSCRSSRST